MAFGGFLLPVVFLRDAFLEPFLGGEQGARPPLVAGPGRVFGATAVRQTKESKNNMQ